MRYEAPEGNKYATGNRGGRRKSAYEEMRDAIWHKEKWEIETDVPVLQDKLKTGTYSVRDVFLAKALQGNDKILCVFANKLLADLVDLRGKDGAALPTPILGYVPKDNSDGEGDEADQADQGIAGGDISIEDNLGATLPDQSSADGHGSLPDERGSGISTSPETGSDA